MNPEVLQALDDGICVVTATRRLAYEVKAAYSAHQLARGKTVWPSPQINTWDGWMQSLWARYSAHSNQICLNQAQLKQLFAQIIQADIKHQESNNEPALAALWNIPTTAKTALEAWQLCHQWKISFTSLQKAAHTDHASFGRWSTQLYARLRERNWISTAQIADSLVAANAPPEQATALFGFDFLNSQQQRFIETFESANISQINSEPAEAKLMQRYVFENTRDEWQQIGAWARSKLLENPDSRLGIITPNSEEIRSIASQSLREQLTPQYFQQTTQEPFHFSQGQPLSSVPIVKTAFTCLDLLGNIEFKQLAPLFLSHYWGNATQRLARAQLLTKLSQKIPYQFDLFQLMRAISKLDSDTTKNQINAYLLVKLSQLQKIKTEHRGTHSIAHWQEVFSQCLSALKWPGSQLNSTEFQAHQAWEKCLDDWLTLDTICPPMRLNAALQSLKQHCQQTQFQVQADINAPVQIMGVLEAAELSFDAVWLAGFDEQAWPVSEKANPFIPISLQIEVGIPAASTALQSQVAELKTAQLCALSDEVHISHAQLQDDITLAVSPLLEMVADTDPAYLPEPFSIHEAIQAATPALVSVADNTGQPLDANYASGGTGLIQAQSICPFRAYAKYRLLAREQTTPEIGMDQRDLGQLMHQLLASIWSQLDTSRALQTHIEQDTLDTLITHHTKSLAARIAQLSGLKQGFEQAQSERLHTLITEWLMLEATRPPFEVIACEQKVEYRIANLKLHFYLDRVDKLSIRVGETADEEIQLIMDYKSGKCELKDWAWDRPEQPQIPLYYLALEHQTSTVPITALTFAQVKQGACQFVGISRDEAVLPEVKSLQTLPSNTSLKQDMGEWSELKPKWQARLETLAEAFQQGIAHVDPKAATSCSYCEFMPLCRIHSLAAREDEDELD